MALPPVTGQYWPPLGSPGSLTIDPGVVNGDFAVWDPALAKYRPAQITTDSSGYVVTDSNGDVVTSFR
jgi:hypothetical protein